MIHTNSNDQEFMDMIEDCSMDPEVFGHEAHVRFAYLHIQKYGVDQACINLCRQIKDFDDTYGNGMIFHVTMTTAAVRIINGLMDKSKGMGFTAFLDENPIVLSDFKSLISQHYSKSILQDHRSRVSLMEPDLASFG